MPTERKKRQLEKVRHDAEAVKELLEKMAEDPTDDHE